MFTPEIFVLPAAALTGRTVRKPKGHTDYLCTLSPQGKNIRTEYVYDPDTPFQSIVYLNRFEYANKWDANKPLKCKLNKEDLIELQEKFSLPDDLELTFIKNDEQNLIKIGDLTK